MEMWESNPHGTWKKGCCGKVMRTVPNISTAMCIALYNNVKEVGSREQQEPSASYGNRTRNLSPEKDFKSFAYTNFAKEAYYGHRCSLECFCKSFIIKDPIEI